MRLSPDGQYEAFLYFYNGHSAICAGPVGTKDITRFDLSTDDVVERPKDVETFRWISDKRLLLTTTIWDEWYGMMAVNRDCMLPQGVSGLETLGPGIIPVHFNEKDFLWAFRCIHSFEDSDENILMLDERTTSGEQRRFPNVVKVDTLDGTPTTVVKNPGDVVGWGVDHDGHVRVGITTLGGLKTGVIYRESESAPWRKLDSPKGLRSPHIEGFDRDNRHLFVAALSPEKRAALYRWELGDEAKSELVIRDPEYDVIPETYIPSIDGISLARLVFSEQKHTLIGVWYLRDAPRVQWFDKDFMLYQRVVDQKMPDTVNLFVNHSRDDKRILFLCFSDRDPGTYCLLDAEKKSFVPIARRMPRIKSGEMAQMLAVHYPARDGLIIHGYLTLPVGYPPKHLPLIVMPHGGPVARDVWGYDPLVQFLANRGYAVLQMDYRGSPGYGEEFRDKGRREVGAAIQDDIEDATRWAVAKGLADPEHIAIVGASYGGYSVLFALGHNPELYKCGVSIAGVTDWMSIYHRLDDPEYRFAREFWKRNIGDPNLDETFLRSISPVNFADKITAPLLLIQGKQDRRVPAGQARAMIAALEKAGRKPESLFLANDGHGMTTPKAKLEGFKAIEAFLAQHLGPGVPPLDADKGAPAAPQSGH
jgi:dipeptidyl aminopeptidase/acylaminoacyl peptidase